MAAVVTKLPQLNTSWHQSHTGVTKWLPLPAALRARIPPRWPTGARGPIERQLLHSDWPSIQLAGRRTAPTGWRGLSHQGPLCWAGAGAGGGQGSADRQKYLCRFIHLCVPAVLSASQIIPKVSSRLAF